ncbi:NAD(P)-dependent oxidoreductase [Trujillonella endophytica]|uniref:3-hydroxyisobutyrate dehydrogenase n=1 Tax=Trujillonella endophytica TaxID=673521 RepID=A0A1H8QPN1_9ACTN|nr:NAD(P)-dependent oxidoreductase [Trujillella endophytica]SEO56179.1 3-hydroxyisobutyrate dehydrogenase [Trujillella endophytica]
MRIGFVGAGRMGRPIVDRLVAAGHAVTVLARRPEARAAAEADGLTCAGTVAETVRAAEVVFCVVLDDAQVRAAFLGEGDGLAAMPEGAVLVQHTTCDPGTLQVLAEAGAARGARVLDAALSGGPHDIAEGRLTLWVGGDDRVLAEVRPLLETYASPVMPVGGLGNGQRVKLVNNALFVSQVGLAIDAVRVARQLGIDEAAILAAVQHGSGASRALGIVAGMGVTAVGDHLAELMLKDVLVVREIAERTGVDLGAIGGVLSSAAVEQGVLRGGAPPGRSAVAARPAQTAMKDH